MELHLPIMKALLGLQNQHNGIQMVATLHTLKITLSQNGMMSHLVSIEQPKTNG